MCCGGPYERFVTDAPVARRLGVPRPHVAELARLPDFPRPVGRVTETVPLWRWRDVQAWARATDLLAA